MDIDYYLFAHKFDKDAPTFRVKGTTKKIGGERVKLCYGADGLLKHMDNKVLCLFEDGRKLLIDKDELTLEEVPDVCEF